MLLNEFYERYWELIEFRKEFSFSREVLKTWDELDKIEKTGTFFIIKEQLIKIKNPKILDIGAGDRKFLYVLNKMGIKCIYKSLDISRNVVHDYVNIDEVQEKFDVIIMLELIEHLPLEQTLKYLSKSFNLLNNNGIIIMSTPNIDHINQLWKQDITHIQQYPAKDLYAILRMIGFKSVRVWRILLTNYNLSIKKKLLELARKYLNKILSTDYTHGILIIAEKHE